MTPLQACQVARMAAGIVAEGIATGVSSLLDGVRQREKELDTLDREIDQGVTSVITKVTEDQARELLACLKFMIGLERVGDLLLNCSNRAASVGSRIDLQDIRDLTLMASRLEKMLGDVHDAFCQRDLNSALAVLRADAEMDRLRNLIFIRHLESHDNTPRAGIVPRAVHDAIAGARRRPCQEPGGRGLPPGERPHCQTCVAVLRQAGGADVHRRPEAQAQKRSNN